MEYPEISDTAAAKVRFKAPIYSGDVDQITQLKEAAARFITLVEQIDGEYELITAMEVIEHTPDPQASVAALAARLPRQMELVNGKLVQSEEQSIAN